MGKSQKFVLLAAGIFVSFLCFGIVQEKIVKATYINPDGSVEHFTTSMSLVIIYCGVNYILSLIVSRVRKQEDNTPTIYYCLGGLVYCLAMVSSTLALQFMSYPAQVITKSCKPIPVMIFGVLLGKRSYSFKKYIFVGMVVFGVILFMYKDVKGEKKELQKSEGIGIGELLVFSSLFMDGLIAALQERMRGDYQTKPMNMMVNLNKWATLFLMILWLLTKEIFTFASFVQRHPTVIWKLSALSVCGFMGQFAMLLTVVEFGTLPASMVATVRKFFTVLTSVLLLGNSLIPRQWVGTVIIFSGLFLDILYGKSDTKVK